MNRISQHKLFKWLIAPVAAVLILGTAAFVCRQPKRDVTTNSGAAYEAYQVGMARYQEVNYAAAQRSFREAVKLDSTFAMAWVRLGRLDYSFRHSTEAKVCYQKALARASRVKPLEKSLIELLGLDLNGTPEQQKECLNRTMARFPNDSEILLIYALKAFHAMDYEKSLAAYRKLVEKDPSKGESYNMIGYALTELNRLPEALEAFQKYAFLYPDQCNPHDSLGELYLRMGRYADAQREFDRALAVNHEFGWGWIHSAMAHADQGEYDEGVTAIRTGLKLMTEGPESPTLRNQLINMYVLAGRVDSVEALCRAREACDGKDLSPWFYRGRVYAARGDAPAAQRQLDEFTKRLLGQLKEEKAKLEDAEKENYVWNELRGVVALADHRWEDADRYLKQSKKMAGSWWLERRMETERLEALVNLGRTAEARQVAESILAVNPNLPAVRQYLARVEGLAIVTTGAAGPGASPAGLPATATESKTR